MNRKDFLPIEIKLSAPTNQEYWERMNWCRENIGKQMGSDDLDPPGCWFHYGEFLNNEHIFCFANEELATAFAMKFVLQFSE